MIRIVEPSSFHKTAKEYQLQKLQAVLARITYKYINYSRIHSINLHSKARNRKNSLSIQAIDIRNVQYMIDTITPMYSDPLNMKPFIYCLTTDDMQELNVLWADYKT